MAIRSRFAAAAQRRAKQRARREQAPRISPTIELHHIRAVRKVMNAFHDVIMGDLEPILPTLAHGPQRRDAFTPRLMDAFQSFAQRAQKASDAFKATAAQTAKRLETFSAKEAVRTLGDYARGTITEVAGFREEFVAEAAVKLRELMLSSIEGVEAAIDNADLIALDVDALRASIEDKLGASLSRAVNSARNAVSQATADLNRVRQQNAGVEQYVWMSFHDARVRPEHKALDGQVCSWDDPPLSASDSSIGVACHAGEDVNCRCSPVAILPSEQAEEETPLFDYEEAA